MVLYDVTLYIKATFWHRLPVYTCGFQKKQGTGPSWERILEYVGAPYLCKPPTLAAAPTL